MAVLEGTQGEPETVAEGSQGEGLSEALGGESGEPAGDQQAADNNTHLKWLESQDPTKLPDAFRKKLEEPFLKNYTRKMTEASEQATAREQRLLDAVTNRLAAQGVTPTPDQTAELREKIKMGDLDVLDQFVEHTMDTRMAPVRDFMQATQRDQAIDRARKMHPWVAEKEPEITSFLKANPLIARFAAQNNYEATPLVLTAIAEHMELEHLKANQKIEIDKAVAAAKKQASSLPSTTSRAGTTPSGTPAKQLPIWDAMEKAYVDSGMHE